MHPRQFYPSAFRPVYVLDVDDSGSDSAPSPALPCPQPIYTHQESVEKISELAAKAIPGLNPERARRSAPPTLATGRRSKFMHLEGEAAIKRDQRRRRNREAARKLKEKRLFIEKQLEKAILDLETEERELLSQIAFLQDYKTHLQRQYARTDELHAHAAMSRSFPVVCKQEQEMREKPVMMENRIRMTHGMLSSSERPRRSGSPQWQLIFGI